MVQKVELLLFILSSQCQATNTHSFCPSRFLSFSLFFFILSKPLNYQFTTEDLFFPSRTKSIKTFSPTRTHRHSRRFLIYFTPSLGTSGNLYRKLHDLAATCAELLILYVVWWQSWQKGDSLDLFCYFKAWHWPVTVTMPLSYEAQPWKNIFSASAPQREEMLALYDQVTNSSVFILVGQNSNMAVLDLCNCRWSAELHVKGETSGKQRI